MRSLNRGSYRTMDAAVSRFSGVVSMCRRRCSVFVDADSLCSFLCLCLRGAGALVLVLVLVRAQGWQRWTDGRTFEGEWKDGKPHGKVSGAVVV